MTNDKPAHWLGQLVIGAGIGALAITADAVDLQQNITFGLQSNTLAAVTYGLAALGVLVVPAVAERLGWSMLLRSVALASVILTFVAALNYHADSEGRRITVGQDKAAAHETAKAEAEAARNEAKAAREEAARITESTSAAQLGELVSQAKGRVASLTKTAEGKGITCQQSKACRAAEADLATLVQRQGQAEAKAAALARADRADAKVSAAKVEAKAGPEVTSGLALMIADTTFAKGQGWTAAGVAWTIAEVMMLSRIALTMAFASLGGYAVHLIASGWAARPFWKSKKPVKAAAPKAPTGGNGGGQRKPAPATTETAKVIPMAARKAAQKRDEKSKKFALVAQLLAAAGAKPNVAEIARVAGLPASTCRNWVKQIRKDQEELKAAQA